MAHTLASEMPMPTFGLIHFSPDPERGDKVCVGIWVDDGKSISVDYDPEFPQVRCVAPGFDRKLLRHLLDDLQQSIAEVARPEAARVIKEYAPQLLTSEPRKIVAPLTERLRAQLRDKFVVPQRDLARMAEASASSVRQLRDQVAQHVESYVRSLIRDDRPRILERPTLERLFGVKPRIKTPAVALAVQTPHRLVVVDGVDLSLMRARKVVGRVNEIVYVFWQLQRMREETLVSRDEELRRVGIVLDGASLRRGPLVEAHDYAIDRFRSEADVAVDASTNEGRDQLVHALND